MALRYMLDTNICIYIAKQKPQTLLEQFQCLKLGEVAMSTITFGELRFGAEKSQHTEKALQSLQNLIRYIPAIPLATDVSEHYGYIRSQLERRGRPIGNNDLWIAAHALALQCVLVTNNEKEFKRVPQLTVENWC